MINLPRQESLTRSGESDVFRLQLTGKWPGVFEGRKVIVERSDVATGRLGDRTATIELKLVDVDQVTLDAEYITNMRTGAAAALGARYLAAASARNVGMVGTGRIAESVVLAVDETVGPDLIRVTSRSPEKRTDFVTRLQPLISARLEAVSSVEEAVGDADVVVAAVPTPEPILSNGMLKESAHLSVVAGDPRTVQLAEDILSSRPVVVDHVDQADKSGDFLRYSNRHRLEYEGRPATIGDAALGTLEEYRGRGCVAYFTGMAIQDLHAAYTCMRKRELGT
jgi:alanine dehydrogenase